VTVVLGANVARVMNSPSPRYREAEVALWGQPGTYRGFVRTDLPYRAARRLRARWDRVEPYLPRAETERAVDALARWFDVRWEGDVVVAQFPEAETKRVAPGPDGLYPVGELSNFRNSVEWTEPFPHMPPDELDAEAIRDLLDAPLPEGIHPRNRQPVWDELARRAGADELVEALKLVETPYARERICVLLAHQRRPREAVPALDTLTELLEADADVAESAAYAIRELVRRAGRERAVAASPELETRLRAHLERERRDIVRDDVRAALGALNGMPPEREPFVRQARRALDFLITDYGFSEPTVDDGGWGTDVIYRAGEIGVVARAEWRDRYAEVLIVRLEDGDLPMYLGTERSHWVRAELAADVQVPTTNADSPELARSFDAWAVALRRCDRILRGDVGAFEAAARRANTRRGR
jgi:hypothetical protein